MAESEVHYINGPELIKLQSVKILAENELNSRVRIISEKNKMKEFLEANPGISSRITFTVEFPSYSPDREMPEIFKKIAENSEYDLEDGWRDIATDFFKERAKSGSFGNGREARKLFQNAIVAQAARLYGKEADTAAMRLITCDDLITAAVRLLEGENQICGKQQQRIGFSH